MLVVAGCGAIVVNAQTGALTHIGVALTFGLIVMVMVASLGPISGAHFNPAVTLGLAVSGYFNWREVPVYIAAQLVGAVSGAATLRALFGFEANLGATLPAGPAFQSFGLEVLLTTLLMIVIMAVVTDKTSNVRLAALAIGGAVAVDALWGGPISGASMNPARSFGPALVAGVWADHWVYWLGPILGAVTAAVLYQWLWVSALAIRQRMPTVNDDGLPANHGSTRRAQEGD